MALPLAVNQPARILVVTNGPLARNPRVWKEASALGAAGHEVTVLTPRNHAPSEPLDAALCAAAPFRRVPVDLVPGFGASPRRVFWRLLRHRLAREAMRRLRVPSLHALGPASVLLRAARAHPADLVIVHNEVPHGIGLRLLAEGRRVAADIEDWHSEDLPPEARRHRPLALLRDQERRLLHHAIGCTTTSEALADALHARYGGRRPDVVTNSFPLPALPARPATGRDTLPRFVWFSQTVGPGRGLEEFLRAWSLTRQPGEVVIVGEDRGGQADRLRALVPAERRARLIFSPPVSPTELPGLVARHDIGLALEHREPANKDLTISNKILQYLGAGLAVVATPTAGQREVLAHAPEAGLLCDFSDPAASAAALDALLADPAALSRRRAAARRLAEERYCWEREAPRLCTLVARSLGR